MAEDNFILDNDSLFINMKDRQKFIEFARRLSVYTILRRVSDKIALYLTHKIAPYFAMNHNYSIRDCKTKGKNKQLEVFVLIFFIF